VNGEKSVGGLVGDLSNGSKLSDCYATGDVNGDSTFGGVGGLVGNSADAEISTSYSVGTVVDSGSTPGGLIGRTSGTVTDSYWDIEASGVSSSDGGTGLTTSEMQGSSAQSNMTGFDFNSVWEVV